MTSERDAFVRCAQEQVGKSYRWATAGPNTFDCSGLVAFCYQQATGKAITRSSHGQFTLGQPVALDAVQPSDLLFYDTMGDGAGHVGIAVGPNEAVHALNAALGVRETAIHGAQLGGPFIGARRLFPASPETHHPKVPKDKRPRRRRRERRTR